MMKRTNSFTMIEIVLAMGVLLVGVVSVLGLFPVGLSAGRDAIAESHACEAADQFLHLTEYGMRRDWNTMAAAFPSSKPDDGDLAYDDTVSGAGRNGSAGTIHDDPGGTAGVFHLVTFHDENDNDKFDSGELTDFRGVMAVWKQNIQIGGSTIPDTTGIAFRCEISWPAQVPYENREKAVYHYELFNR